MGDLQSGLPRESIQGQRPSRQGATTRQFRGNRTPQVGFVALAFVVAFFSVAQSADQRAAEIGPDFQISTMGGTDQYGLDKAEQPAVACSSTDTSCLVVWRGEEDVAPLADMEYEIFGTVVTPGAAVPAHIRFSAAGPVGNNEFYVWDPAVAHNSTDNEFLVAWSGADNNEKYEFDIYGARYIPATSSVTASVEISDSPDQGTTGWEDADTERPDIVHNPTANEYFVVYQLNVYDAGTGTHQKEIFARRLTSAGTPLGSQIRISTMGPEPPNATYDDYDGDSPAVAYNSVGDSYLVVWFGNTNVGGLHIDEKEIWGQLVDGATGALKGGHIRISTAGADGDPSPMPNYPDVAASPDSREFLAVWSDDRNGGGQEDIWAQRVSSETGALRGSNFEISQTLPPVPDWFARAPAITYNTQDLEYLVVWYGNPSNLGAYQIEASGQRLDPYGSEIGTNDFRISHAGPDSAPDPALWSAWEPEVAYSPVSREYLAVWTGGFPAPTGSAPTNEIFGQRLMPYRLKSFVAER